MVCKDSPTLCTLGKTRLTNITENKDRDGVRSKTVASHSKLKKYGAESMISATETVMLNSTKEIKEITTEMREHAMSFALKIERPVIGESQTVSKVPFSFSPTKAQEAEATEQIMGTHKYNAGHSKVVNASIQNCRYPLCTLSAGSISRIVSGN